MLGLASAAQDSSSYFQLKIEDVVNNRELNGSRITDDAGLLSDSAQNYIDSLLIDLENTHGYQISLVNLDSIGDQDMRFFGTDLFNLWGLGQEGKDNGLLIFNVMNIRRIEFITGYGTESVLSDLQCQKIQQVEMLPHYKNGEFEKGIIAGIEVTIDVLKENTPEYLLNLDIIVDDPYTDTSEAPVYTHDFKDDLWFLLLFYLGLSMLIAAIPTLIFIICLLIALFAPKLSPHQRFKKIWLIDHFLIAFFFPVPFLLFVIIVKLLKRKWRRETEGDSSDIPVSLNTGETMTKLSPKDQNLVLAKGLLSVEDVHSDLIDVYGTADLSEAVVKKHDLQWSIWKKPSHGDLYTKYTQCKKCKHKACYLKSSDTISETETTTIYNRVVECTNCLDVVITEHSYKKYIPTYSSSSGSASSKSASSSWFKSSSSSSSSYKSAKKSSSSSNSSSKGSSYGGGKSGSGGSGSTW